MVLLRRVAAALDVPLARLIEEHGNRAWIGVHGAPEQRDTPNWENPKRRAGRALGRLVLQDGPTIEAQLIAERLGHLDEADPR
jgi:hypothetical protein